MCAALSPDSNPIGSADENITTAVVFLEEVSEKGYEEGVLRTYLVNKCGLSSSEVAKALEIHAQLMKNKKLDSALPKGEKIISRGSTTVNVKRLENKHSGSSKPKIKYTPENVLSFLKPDKRTVGLKVIKEFLKTEWKYCNILTCLEDYCKELTKLAGQRKIQMSIKEVEDIFVRVPSLLHFHRMFYTDLTRGYSIGQLFIKCFNFFKAYIEYMKSCTSTINKMRQYARDQRLHNYLAQIRQRSKELEDMFDLLLFPLDRVSDYKVFLDKLCKLADEEQNVDYEYLTKAARRIGRIATYIEKYKYWIFNRSEMNRVQRFLDHQWDILAPHRRIIRRGIMLRRSMGWSQRNKRFIFFLFNDLFLWTSEKGELQNVVYLWNCKVYDADSKSNSSRTFKLAFMGKKHGTLLLECSGTRQMQEWYNAIKKAISGANDRIAQAWSKTDLQYSKDDEPSGEAIIVETLTEEKQECDIVLPMPSSSLPVQRIGREKETSRSRGHDIFTSDATYDEHYENAHNFRIQEFKEFEPMDDAVSISGSDQRFHHGSKSPSTTEPMSAFKIKPKATRVSSEEKKYASGAFSYGAYDEFSDARSQCSIRRRGESLSDAKKISPGRVPQRQRLDSFGDDIKHVVKERRHSISSSPSLQVFPDRKNTAIRRSDDTADDLPLETLLRRTSSFTMRLNDLKTLRLTDVSEK